MAVPAQTPGPVGAPQPTLTPFEQKVVQARSLGYSNDQIADKVSQQYDKAIQAGYSPADIQHYMGFSPQAQAQSTQTMAAQAKATYQAQPPQPQATDNPFDLFMAGLKSSSGGLIAHAGAPGFVPSQHAGMISRLAYAAGDETGDLPAQIIGGLGGAAAGAAVPGADLTGVPEAIGAGAGAMGLPEHIKQQYADEIKHGAYKSAGDFAERQTSVWGATAVQAGIGAATFGTGKYVGGALEAGGMAVVPRTFLRGSSELAAQAAATYALTGKLMTKEDLIDSAILMAGFHGAVHLAKTSTPIVAAAKQNLSDNWVKTGETPSQATARVANDPVQRQGFSIPNDTPRFVPPGSASHGNYVLPKVPGSFEAAASWMLKTEGGLTADTGGVTKYGISANAHPGVDIKNLSVPQAVQIYHDDYWKPMGIDNLPKNMQLPAFDAAINEGVAKAKEMLAESGNDPQKFQELREQHYRSLAEGNPTKYGKYLPTWLQRIGSPNAGVPLSDGFSLAKDLNDGNEPSSEELKGLQTASNDDQPGFLQRFAADESGAIPGKAKQLTDDMTPEAPADAWASTAAHMSDVEKPPSFSENLKTMGAAVYREMAAPDRPIGKLVDAVMKGGSIADADNPKFLARVAETSDSRAQYMLERNMVDTQGNITGPGLKPILAPFEGEQGPKNFWTYSIARWAAEKAGQNKETGVDLSNALQVIQEGHGKYGEAFKQLQEWQNGTLAYARDAGLITPEAFDRWTTENQARIPGYRDLGNAPGGPKGAKGLVGYNPVKEMVGSDKNILNIQQSLMRDAFLRVELANNNMFARSAMDAAASIGMATKVGDEKVDLDMSKASDAATKIDPDADVTLAQLSGSKFGKDEVPVLRDGNLEKWIPHDPELTRLLRGYDQQSLATWQKIAAIPAKFQRSMITLNPLFPVHILAYDVPFQAITKPGLRNTIADAYTGLGHVFGKTDTWDEWMRKGNPDRVFQGLNRNDYMRNVLKGNDDPDFLGGVFNAIKTPADMLKAWSMNMSQVMPVGRYARRAGDESDLAAGYAASEAPFHRSKYGGPAAKALNTTIPFFTAYINSLEKTGRALVGISRPGEPEVNAAQTWAKAAAFITLPILGGMAHNHDKIWYKNVPDYVKDNALLMHFGDDWEVTDQKDELGNPIVIPHGHTFTYKYPPILSLLFGAIPRRLAEQFLYDNPDAWDDFGKSVASSFAPPGGMTYSAFLPILEHVSNYSFFRGQPIVPDSVAHNLPTAQKYTPYSTVTARALSAFVNDIPLVKNLNLSPPIIDNYISQYAGTLGEAATHTIDMGLQAAGVARQRDPTPHLEDTPLLSSWMTRYPSASAQPTRDFDASWAKYQGLHEQLALALKNDDFATFQQTLSDHPEAAAGRLALGKGTAPPGNPQQYEGALEAAQPQIKPEMMQWLQGAKAIQNEEKMIKYINSLPGRQDADNPAAPFMTSAEKRQQLDQHYATIQMMSERVNEVGRTAGIR